MMEIQISTEGATKHIPLKIDNQSETLVSQITHQEAVDLGEKSREIDAIDFEVDDRGELKNLELLVDDTISLKIHDGKLQEFKIFRKDINVSHDTESDRQNRKQQPTIKSALGDNSEQKPPHPPEIDTDELSSSYEKRYNAMSNEGTQPYLIREIIHDEDEISKRELKNRLQEAGYDVKIGQTHTGVNETLRLLDNYTEEIQRNGRGESKTIKWIGHPQSK